MNTCTLYVNGMHCASCEVLIERKLRKLPGVSKVDAKLSSKEVEIESSGDLDLAQINRMFIKDGYSFSAEKVSNQKLISRDEHGQIQINTKRLIDLVQVIGITLAIVIVFLLVERVVNNQFSSLTTSTGEYIKSFILGIIASVSTCAALVGGIILSMSKTWDETYQGASMREKATPHLGFHLGRLISYTLMGGLLGIIGEAAIINQTVKSILIIVVSLVMILLGLQMLGVSWSHKVKLTMPKSVSARLKSEHSNNWGALLAGAGTVLLPCSLTLYAFSNAITSGSVISGAVIMLLFALGSLPVLAAISGSSLLLKSQPLTSAKFNLVAGLLVVFFALYSINSQLNALGLVSLSDLFVR